MNKSVSITTIAYFIVILSCSPGGKYGDVKEVMNEMIKIQEVYTSGLENAQNAQDVAIAINKYIDSMKTVLPQALVLEKKYPELKQKKGENAPAELQEIQKKMQESTREVAKVSQTILMKYISDAEVNKAMHRMTELRPSPAK